MKEKPILFSTPMVQAILEGRKTMTRRIFKNVIKKYSGYRNQCAIQRADDPESGIEALSEKEFYEVYAPYSKGDVLWVREAFSEISWPDGTTARKYETVYKATPPINYPYKITWKPSIHIRHNQSRISLEVTDIHIERLQDISENDAKAEGVGKGFLLDWLKNFSMEYPYWNYWDSSQRYYCKKHIEKGIRDFRKEVMAGEVPGGLEELSKKEIREELDNYMSDLIEEESPIFCDICGKPLSFSALPSILEELDEYLEGSLTESEAPILESLMCNYEDELFSREDIHRLLFSGLWNNINTKRTWESNPWVWVIEFRRIEK